MTLLAGQRLHAEDLGIAPVDVEQINDNTTTSTAFVFGDNAVSLTFTGPPSGRVKCQIYAAQANTTASASCYTSWQIREGTTQSGAVVYDNGDLVGFRTSGVTTIQAGTGRMGIATGLIPGSTYTVWARFRVSAGTGTWYTTALFLEPSI